MLVVYTVIATDILRTCERQMAFHVYVKEAIFDMHVRKIIYIWSVYRKYDILSVCLLQMQQVSKVK
jgi:hypothetical protein